MQQPHRWLSCVKSRARHPQGNAETVAAAIRTIFARPDAAHVTEQFEVIATMLGRSHPKVAVMMHDAREALLAFTGYRRRLPAPPANPRCTSATRRHAQNA